MNTRFLRNSERLKKALVVLLVGVVAAAGTALSLVLSGAIASVPQVAFPSIDVVLTPVWVAALATFVVVTVVGLLYVFFRQRFVQMGSRFGDKWQRLPKLAKAIVFGAIVAGVAGGSVALTSAYGYRLPRYLPIVVFFLAWLVVAFLTFRHLVEKDELARWATAFALGCVVAAVGGGLVAAVDFYYFYTVPDYVAGLVFLLGWPVATLFALRKLRARDDGLFSVLLVKTGYAQLRRLETKTVALVLGFLVALLVGASVRFAGADLQLTAFSFVAAWVLVTFVTTRRYEKMGSARTDLIIADVRDRTSGPSRELAVRNEGEEPVDLCKAKIRDTNYNLYRLDLDVVLGAGETGTFDIPPEFTLEPSDTDIGVELPFGYSLRQGEDAAMIYTRGGEEFKLQWDDVAHDGVTTTESPDSATGTESIEH